MKNLLKRFMVEEDGLEPIEYALMLALVALVAVVGAYTMAGSVSDVFTDVGGSVDSANGIVDLSAPAAAP